MTVPAPISDVVTPVQPVADRLWLASDGTHRAQVHLATRWLASGGPLPRGAKVAVSWDGSSRSEQALWVATRLGLDVTVVSDTPVDDELWQRMDDQSTCFGGRMTAATELPAGARILAG